MISEDLINDFHISISRDHDRSRGDTCIFLCSLIPQYNQDSHLSESGLKLNSRREIKSARFFSVLTIANFRTERQKSLDLYLFF
jgi:hypothetical protein